MSDGQAHGERLEGFAQGPPRDDNVKIRLVDGGPMIDLGCDAPTLLTEALKMLGQLSRPGQLSPILGHALAMIKGEHAVFGKRLKDPCERCGGTPSYLAPNGKTMSCEKCVMDAHKEREAREGRG